MHLLLSLMLSGAMRWDVLRPWRRFADRFVLSAGHTVPLVYATLAVLNEAHAAPARARGRGALRVPRRRQVGARPGRTCCTLRRRGGLPGHAEMEGKTLFLKWNTGPSGHGMPPAAGEALALKLAGASEVKVFVVEGEGGLTPGASHETKNSAWGLGLSNLVFLVDWNDFGIDDNPISSVVHGTPPDWFAPYGWRVVGTEQGMEWARSPRALLEACAATTRRRCRPWSGSRRARGAATASTTTSPTARPGRCTAPSSGRCARQFMEKYGVEYQGVDQPAPADSAARAAQARANFDIALSVLRRDERLVDYTARPAGRGAGAVPEQIPTFNLDGKGEGIFSDERLFDFKNYPASLWKKPGDKQPNRAALAAWGAWVNTFAQEGVRPAAVHRVLRRPRRVDQHRRLRQGLGRREGLGLVRARARTRRGALLPQQITEFTNAGIMVGIASVNLAADPMDAFDGFWGACSTYGSFSYLKYGPMRLFSQLAQDCELKVGKVLWVAGHSGPETAEDSRTHFGIFEPGVTQLFPDGHVIDLHPWEYNEVPVVLAAALRTDGAHRRAAPDAAGGRRSPTARRSAWPSHFEAARGGYVMRDFRPGQPRGGTVFVQGTTSTANLVKVLPELDRAGLNVKIVAAISPQLFALQDAAYRDSVMSVADRWDAMCITNRGLKLMDRWLTHPLVRGVLAVLRLGQPLAHRRHRRRGHRRGAPRPRAHPRRDRALRARSGQPPAPAAGGGGRRRTGGLTTADVIIDVTCQRRGCGACPPAAGRAAKRLYSAKS